MAPELCTFFFFLYYIGCTLESSVLRRHIAPTEPVEHSCTCYIIQKHITHVTHITAAHGRMCTHMQQYTPNTQKRPGTTHSFETVTRDAEEKKKERETHLDRGVPTNRKICRQRHFTEV